MSNNMIRVNKGYSSGIYYYESIILKVKKFVSGYVSPISITDGNNYIEYRTSVNDSGIYLNNSLLLSTSNYHKEGIILGVKLDISNKEILFYNNRVLLYTADISIFSGEIYPCFISIPGEYDIEIDYNFGERKFNKISEIENNAIPYDPSYDWWINYLPNSVIGSVNKSYSSGKYYGEVSIYNINPINTSMPLIITDGNNSIEYDGEIKPNDILGYSIDLDKMKYSFYRNNTVTKSGDLNKLNKPIYIKFLINNDLDIEYNFGANEFKGIEWDRLYDRGYLPYDNDNALWLPPKENNTKAIYVNGTNSYISIPHNINQRPINIYGSLYIRPTELLNNNMTILRYNTNGGIYLKLSPDRDLIFGVMRDGYNEYDEILYNIPLNKIYDLMNIEFSYDGQVSKLYLDNIVVAEEVYEEYRNIKNGTNSALVLGKHNIDNKEYFKGNIDEIKLFNKTLDAETRDYYKDRSLLGTEDGLIGYYRLNSISGDIVLDESSLKLNGTLNNCNYVLSDNDQLLPPYIDIIYISRIFSWVGNIDNINIVVDSNIENPIYSVYINYRHFGDFATNNIDILSSELDLGNNTIYIKSSNKIYNISSEYIVVRENKDTFRFERVFDNIDYYNITDENICMISDGMVLNSPGQGLLELDIYTEGKNQLKNISDNRDKFIEDILPVITSVSQDGYIVTASSQWNASYPGWKAFNKTNVANTDCWISGNHAWIQAWVQIELPNLNVVNKYKITSRNIATPSDIAGPKDWVLLGSNNNNTWSQIHSVSNEPEWNQDETRQYVFDNNIPYKMYRLYISDKHGLPTGSVCIGKLELFDTSHIIKEEINISNDMGYIKDLGDYGKVYEERLLTEYKNDLLEIEVNNK